MTNQKVKLTSLKVQSFVTEFKTEEQRLLYGGQAISRFHPDACIDHVYKISKGNTTQAQ